MGQAFPTPVILCGGIGERLAPISTPSYPKQFLSMAGAQSLLEMTFARVQRLCPDMPVYITTTAALEPLARTFVPASTPFITEPLRRNTAAAIALTAQSMVRDDILWFMPCDHLIAHEDRLRAAMPEAARLALNGHIVLFGIRPGRPETRYGYIKCTPDGRVLAFKEKPDDALARAYVAAGDYVWNSGMIVARGQTLLDEFARLAPAYIAGNPDSRYPQLAAAPFDTLILEKTDKTRVIPIDMGWQDIGAAEHVALFDKKYAERTE